VKKRFFTILALLVLFFLTGCATSPSPSGTPSRPIALAKANLEAVIEEHDGVEVFWENARDLRDFYRGGVQQKAKGEGKFQEKIYPEALKLYEKSNEFFLSVLAYDNRDSAEYTLFEGTNILFFPNLLLADNYLKMGRILWEMGNQSSARRRWKQALPYLTQSLSFLSISENGCVI